MLARIKFEIGGLVREIVERLPAEVFTSTETTFLDPAMAGGQFLVEIIRKLRDNGHSDDNIASRVFGLAEDRLDLNYAQRKNGVIGQLAVGGIETLENYKNMGKKFDVVIGNPPYQATSEGGADPLSNRLSGKRDLYDKFIEMADQLADTWALVSPCFWLGRPNHKLYKLVMPKVSYVIKTTEWFKSVAGVETAAFVCNPNPSDHVTLVHSGSDVTLPRSDVRGFVSSDVHGILTRLRKSGLVGMDTIHFQSNEFVRSKINASPSGTYSYVDITGASDQVDPVYLKSVTPLIQKHTGKSRLVCNWNGSTTSIGAIKHIADKNAAISASCVALVCGSDTEASNLRQVLMSKLYRFVVANVKTSATNNKATFKELPLVDLTRSWTDAELYAHFNLTQEEIDLIEATVK